jgi:hypothetical protein
MLENKCISRIALVGLDNVKVIEDEEDKTSDKEVNG